MKPYIHAQMNKRMNTRMNKEIHKETKKCVWIFACMRFIF